MEIEVFANVGSYPVIYVDESPVLDKWVQPGWYVGDSSGPLSHGPMASAKDAVSFAEKLDYANREKD